MYRQGNRRHCFIYSGQQILQWRRHGVEQRIDNSTQGFAIHVQAEHRFYANGREQGSEDGLIEIHLLTVANNVIQQKSRTCSVIQIHRRIAIARMAKEFVAPLLAKCAAGDQPLGDDAISVRAELLGPSSHTVAIRLPIYRVDEAVAKASVDRLPVKYYDATVLDAEPSLDNELAQHGANQAALDQLEADSGPARELIVTDKEELFGQLKVRHRSSPYAHRHGRATTWISLSVSRRETAAEQALKVRKRVGTCPTTRCLWLATHCTYTVPDRFDPVQFRPHESLDSARLIHPGRIP